MPRGGRRAGRPGAKYENRTDLALAPRTAPIARIPGQGYGEQAAQVSAQQAVPTGVPATPTPAPRPAPDIMGRLTAPTERPDEPVQTGLPTGPGPGPEALGMQYGEPSRLAPYVAILELAASRPSSSPALRQFVRTLRGGL